MFQLLSAVLVFVAAAAGQSAASRVRYNTNASRKDGMLNVHLVCHTHDDVGWLKTIDQYFMGANNTIQHAGVQYILDSVVTSLQANPDRKFIYVEQGFFMRWWFEQTPEKQAVVKDLVKRGQLEFINGAYCMHDEATPSYVDMIDQTTIGHRFLFETFGVVPKVTWQIDPFGHSSAQASLMTAEMGFEAMYFARIDYEDRALRINESSLEMVWRASPSYGARADAFTGVFYHHYGPPDGLCFDMSCNDATPIQDDPWLEDQNVQYMVDLFVNRTLKDQALHFRGNDIMLLMGEDFNYEQADEYFKNLDKLIHYVNKDGRVNAFYSTPSIYTAAKAKYGIEWPIKTDDFFPYADIPHAYWTGYFTSRPALKGYVRTLSNYLQSARQMLLWTDQLLNQPKEFVGLPEYNALSKLEYAMATVQHHDAVSGTEKQHVADDYAKRMSIGHSKAAPAMQKAWTQLTGKDVAWQECPLRNTSVCSPSETQHGFFVALYNGLGQSVLQPITLPVSQPAWVVLASDGRTIASQVTDMTAKDSSLRKINGGDPTSANYTLHFMAPLIPLGVSQFLVRPAPAQHPDASVYTPSSPAPADGDVTISNKHLDVTFSKDTNMIARITNKDYQIDVSAAQTYWWYNSSTGIPNGDNGENQPSGAYVFRPNASEPFSLGASATLSVTQEGPVLTEVTQVIEKDWVTQKVRLYQNASYIDVEWTVGPIPINDGFGKEVISRFDTNLATDKTWYTDSNGRDLIQRIRDYRETWKLNLTEPVAGNYVPVNFAIKANDSTNGNAFIINVDRSQAGTSLKDGSVELMVHRRLLHDDYRGVGEPLNETGITGDGLIVRGLHRISLEPESTACRALRGNLETVSFPPLVAIGKLSGDALDAFMTQGSASASFLTNPLPSNVHLLTLNRFSDDGSKLLLRIAHMYGVGEDATMSQPVTLSLASMFTKFQIVDATEYTLSASQPVSQVNKTKWSTPQGPSDTTIPTPPQGEALSITLNPMQIRTFVVTITGNK